MNKEVVYFGMGCFWHPQKLFSGIKGVMKTEVGFMGGDESKKMISYEDICSGETGHAEVVKIEFDDTKISFFDLLDLFWKNHDATQLNKQGPDFGEQYRSVIFYTSDKQRKEAEESRRKVQKIIGNNRKIQTEIKNAGKFYKAEEYHQKYLQKRNLKTCFSGIKSLLK